VQHIYTRRLASLTGVILLVLCLLFALWVRTDGEARRGGAHVRPSPPLLRV
jgi:ABC-type transporter Mla subunit MlaD